MLLQFKKFYSEVELITDKLDYNLLIEKRGLPYTNVQITLDRLNDYHPGLWSLGKIYTYSMQSNPFMLPNEFFISKEVFLFWNKNIMTIIA